MNPTSIEVGDVIERCGREVVRFVGTIHGDVRVFKGDGATLYFDQFRTELHWFAEQGEDCSDDHTLCDFPFNVVRVARDKDGKKMHLIFFSEHYDFADEFDELELEDGDDLLEDESEEGLEASSAEVEELDDEASEGDPETPEAK